MSSRLLRTSAAYVGIYMAAQMHKFLSNNRDELAQRCRIKVGQRPGRSATENQLQNGIPLFLDQLIRTLKIQQTSKPLDLDMPSVDGLALARKLKAEPDTRDICVVAVTFYPEQYPKDAALAAGCDAYILKPIDTCELSDQLTAVAEVGRAVN